MRLLATIGLLAAATCLPAQTAKPAPQLALHIALVAAPDSERGKAVELRLRDSGMNVRRVAPSDCDPTAFWNADLVVVDWPAGQELKKEQHGEFLRWHRPTLFFADAGVRFAKAWYLPNAKQMAELDPAKRGPAMQQLTIGNVTPLSVWRHGNFFYLPEDMAAHLTADGFAQFEALTHRASRFVVDRPVVRFSAPDDVARRDQVATLVADLNVDIGKPWELQALPARLRTKDERAARKLLASCLEGGPSQSTTLNNWKNWMRPRLEGMHWDALSQLWRVDELAHWRGVASNDLRGDDRADAGVLDERAIAIAKKTVQHYGGRALDDLETFSCWHGELHYLWDRRRGYFRVECHVTKFARATPWKASVMDSLTDKQLIWGNGGGRGPRIAARSMYRDMIMRTFLPMMLLDPGMRLRYLEEQSTEDRAVLGVRLAGRGLELKSEYVITVSRETGAVISFLQRKSKNVANLFELVETQTCGPLTLPTKWLVRSGRRDREHTIQDLVWNPELPTGIESATERLTTPRNK